MIYGNWIVMCSFFLHFFLAAHESLLPIDFWEILPIDSCYDDLCGLHFYVLFFHRSTRHANNYRRPPVNNDWQKRHPCCWGYDREHNVQSVCCPAKGIHPMVLERIWLSENLRESYSQQSTGGHPGGCKYDNITCLFAVSVSPGPTA